MHAIQLGIGHSISRTYSAPERDILMVDFTVVETHEFPAYVPCRSFFALLHSALAALAIGIVDALSSAISECESGSDSRRR